MSRYEMPVTSGVLGLEGRYRATVPTPRAIRLGPSKSVSAGGLRLYTCGITPYDVTHLGHASTYVWADVLRTIARASGADPIVARNITDVDDVLTQAAAVRGRPYDELALTQEFLFDRDMSALGVAVPDVTPRARGHIVPVIRLAAALLQTGDAYEADGYVYFSGDGVLAESGLDADEALRRSHEYGDQTDQAGRRSRWDVALWRPSASDQPAWPSPWGWGRPGWHAECAAMALSSLGRVDVLWGGSDLDFPHHGYQRAIGRAALGGNELVSHTAHVGEVQFKGDKMAKSTGNLVLVADLLTRVSPAVVRMLLIDRVYTEPWEFDDVQLRGAQGRLAALTALAKHNVDARNPSVGAPATERLLDLLCDDLQVPVAIDHALEEATASGAAYLCDILKLA